jgi:hypothetical protein
MLQSPHEGRRGWTRRAKYARSSQENMPDDVLETNNAQDQMFLTVTGEGGPHKILYRLGFIHSRHESEGRMDHLFSLIDANVAIRQETWNKNPRISCPVPNRCRKLIRPHVEMIFAITISPSVTKP